MATMQEQGVVEKMMQAAKEISIPNNIQLATRGCIDNHTNKDINFCKEKIWFNGSVLKPYPNTIKVDDYGSFIHIADFSQGSMEAVIYSGFNNYDKPCAWLLAWFAPLNTSCSTNSNDKVYVECGELKNYEPINWDEIKSKLLNSGSESRYMDKCTSTTAQAMINSEFGIAAIGACFSAYN